MMNPVDAPGAQDRAGERFLVTGALGCIGAWTLRNLAREGTPVVAFDQATDPRRVRQICTDEELAGITFASGDITDLASIERALDEHAITNIIHLAALQVYRQVTRVQAVCLRRDRSATQDGFDARHQLARVERFGEIVVRAQLQPHDLVHVFVTCR